MDHPRAPAQPAEMPPPTQWRVQQLLWMGFLGIGMLMLLALLLSWRAGAQVRHGLA